MQWYRCCLTIRSVERPHDPADPSCQHNSRQKSETRSRHNLLVPVSKTNLHLKGTGGRGTGGGRDHDVVGVLADHDLDRRHPPLPCREHGRGATSIGMRDRHLVI